MCPPTSNTKENAAAAPEGNNFKHDAILALTMILSICAIIMVGELGSLVSFASKSSSEATSIYVNSGSGAAQPTTVSDGSATSTVATTEASDNVPDDLPPVVNQGENICAGKKPELPDVECVIDALENIGPQAGANVTKGYNGDMGVDHVPITTPYWQNSMCPVNVHWHLGAEHLSAGEYDETGDGPKLEQVDGGIRQGHQCTAYDENDSKFTKPYAWKWCKYMEIGATYEVHWPHSAAGACGTPNQYQTPFYDGVFCMDGVLTDTASQIGVQAQVFIVVNDESYFFPDLMRGMIVDGDMGSDVAKYTGSTTGDGRTNEICSSYSPITWQVDRKCHPISASSFDKLCYDMLQQRDDMSGDIYPHGSRETVADHLAADNHANRYLRS